MSTRQLWGAALILLVLATCAAAPPGVNTNPAIEFATVEGGRTILTTRDAFIQALSPFDRAARMKTDREVPEREFLDFVGQNVEAWQTEETNTILRLAQRVLGKTTGWHLPFPPTIVFVKTSGREEGQASYTRANAVILPEKEMRSANLEKTITHELFHILSRCNPPLRKQLYGTIGFLPIAPVRLPEELQQRKITNPDGIEIAWAITVTNQGRALPVIPILFASAAHFDPEKRGEFFDYLVFRLLEVRQKGGAWEPDLTDGRPQLLNPREVEGYVDQVGRNTDYMIHPDEILADNFVLLVNGRTNLASPRVLADMDRVLRQQQPHD